MVIADLLAVAADVPGPSRWVAVRTGHLQFSRRVLADPHHHARLIEHGHGRPGRSHPHGCRPDGPAADVDGGWISTGTVDGVKVQAIAAPLRGGRHEGLARASGVTTAERADLVRWLVG